MHDLDRPVWATLNASHAVHSFGNHLARRFVRDVNVFGAARDDSPEALAALAGLVEEGETIVLAQVAPIPALPGLTVVKQAEAVQMVAHTALPRPRKPVGMPLSDADVPEMVALATLTEPGPFLARTHVLGRFIGVRHEGRLIAMAGERMRFAGHTEVSGVCVHPDFRGRGLARQLTAEVAARIAERGDVAFLHAWSTNEGAIALYRALGFEVRATVRIGVFGRPMQLGA